MKLHEATHEHVPGISGVHVGTAEPAEMARFLTEPVAVLRGAGLNIGEDATPDAVIIVPRLDGGRIIGWIGVTIIDGNVVSVFNGPVYFK